MSKAKIYTASPSDLSPPVQSESFCVDLVLASDYRELEAKCVALAAECESKKSALAAILEHCPVNDPDIDKAVAAMIAYDNLCCEKTPATDDFLAEVRAQGVEMFAKIERVEAAAELVGGSVDISMRLKGSAIRADAFAAQLREESAK